MPTRISRTAYAGMYGPTVGDRVRLELMPRDRTRGRVTKKV